MIYIKKQKKTIAAELKEGKNKALKKKKDRWMCTKDNNKNSRKKIADAYLVL